MKEKVKFFRINSLKSSEKEVLNELNFLGFSVEKTFVKNAFQIKEDNEHVLSRTELFRNGKIYIQDISSQVPILALDPKPNTIHLDLTASPGSKTTQAASLMENSGVIFANEPVKSRIAKLIENLENQSVLNAIPTTIRGEAFSSFFNNFFDTAIVDPPCSSLGRDPNMIWYPKKSKVLAITQVKILKSAFLSLKEDGVLIYSTCTDRIEENEMVIQKFLKQFSDKCELISLSSELENFVEKKFKKCIFKRTEEKINSEIVEKTLNLDGLGEKFFVAKIKKTKPTFSKSEKLLKITIEDFFEEKGEVNFTIRGKQVKLKTEIWEKLKPKLLISENG